MAVLGSGMAAMGAAHVLRDAGVPAVCFEAQDQAGGHTTTFEVGSGFLFDDGPHVSFTKDERIAALLADAVDGHYRTVEAVIDNVWQGHRVRHPVQLNLHGLPKDLAVSVIADFVAETSAPPRAVNNYADWLVAAYGRTFAEAFPMVYGRKYHTTEPENLTTEWLGPRMYRPDLEEVLRGALDATRQHKHYVTEFRYPERGGFGAYLVGLRRGLDVQVGRRVVRLDPQRRLLRFADGRETQAEAVISSIPLPDLVPIIEGAPPDVLAAARALSYSSATVVNIGVERDDLSPAHITYYYDPDVIFARLNFPHMFTPHVTPAGAGSIQAEVYHSDRYRPLGMTSTELVERVLTDLRRCGVLRTDDRLLVAEARPIRYANVIWDHQRADAVDMVHSFLASVGVVWCGRYGDWDHAWTDEAFLSGERAGRHVLAGTRLGTAAEALVAGV
ncbi:protoporphyrinogen/coproporphyrinogen oxidase [Geodermatophilus sp. SYSU D00742]